MGLTKRSVVTAEDGATTLQQQRQQQQLFEDQLAASASADTSSLVAAESTAFEGRERKCDDGVSIALLLTTLLGIGIGFFALLNAITMARRRRRRRDANDDDDYPAGFGVMDKMTALINDGRAN